MFIILFPSQNLVPKGMMTKSIVGRSRMPGFTFPFVSLLVLVCVPELRI